MPDFLPTATDNSWSQAYYGGIIEHNVACLYGGTLAFHHIQPSAIDNTGYE